MREYPNVLKRSLEKDDAFNNEVQSAVKKIFDEEKESLIKNKKFNAKVIQGNGKIRYLFVNDLNKKTLAVYAEEISSWNKKEPFSYAISSLNEKEGKIYSYNKVLSFKLEKEKAKSNKKYAEMLERFKELSKELGKSAEELVQMLMNAREMNDDTPYSLTSSPYELNHFCKFLGVERDTDFWVKNCQDLNPIIQPKVGDIMININYMFDVAEKNKFNSKNKFEFNDLDNHMWKQENGIALDDQNLGFYCVLKGDDLTIYAWDKERTQCKANDSLSKLLKDIKAGNKDVIDNVALKIENGNVVFVDNALFYCLELDIRFTKNALVNEGFGEPQYPVDIYSYDYQLAYYQRKWGMHEFGFMNQALLTLGGGFDYDSKNGRFYDDSVTYDPSIVKYMPAEKEEKAIGVYGYPVKFKNLDKDWTAALGRFVEKLKKDRPEPIIGDSKEEKKKILDDIITNYEKAFIKLNKANKNKP